MGFVVAGQVEVESSLRNLAQAFQVFFPKQDKRHARETLNAFVSGADRNINGAGLEIDFISRQTADAVHQIDFFITPGQFAHFF